jgi:CO/xanthine dehydrogenase FAD-binding subunit
MISFDFEYYKPATILEAVELHQRLSVEGKEPKYYGGGTEIITGARLNWFRTGAVIDIKGIPECNVMQFYHDKLVLGATISLTQVSESNLFPLLSRCAGRAADFTSRNKITLGGNLCGQIFYREAVLPFLLADSLVVIAGPSGVKHVPIHEVFDGQLRFAKGEFLVQVLTQREDTELPAFHAKKTMIEIIDYPLVTVAALKKHGRIRVAISGVCAFPFRSLSFEAALNDPTLPWEQRVYQAFRHLPAPILHDSRGSAEYRAFVLKNTLADSFERLEGVQL